MAGAVCLPSRRRRRLIACCQVNHLDPVRLVRLRRRLLPLRRLLLLPLRWLVPLLLLLLFRGVAVHGGHGLAGLLQDDLVEGLLGGGEAQVRLLR